MISFTKYIIMAMLTTSLYSQVHIQTFTLPSGLVCKLVENHESPLIRITLVNKWGADEIALGETGLGGLLAKIISELVTNEYNNSQTYMQAYKLDFKADTGSYYWNLTTNSFHQEAAMELLASTVTRLTINTTTLEKQRQTLLQEYALLSPRSLALNKFLCSTKDPMAMLSIESATSNNFNYKNLITFKDLAIRPENSVMAIYGDLSLSQAKQLVMLYFGIWSSPKKSKLAKLFPNVSVSNNHKITAIPEMNSRIEVFARASCPDQGIAQATKILLPITLNRIVKYFSNALQISFSLSTDLSHLLIKTQIPKADQDHQIIEFITTLDKLQKNRISSNDLRHTMTQWRAKDNALSLHPSDLLYQIVNGRLDPDLSQAIELVKASDIDQAIKQWLNPEIIRILLLGADIPKQTYFKKAGLLTWTDYGSTS